MKNILIIEFGFIDIENSTYSGTSKCGIMLFEELKKYSNCFFASDHNGYLENMISIEDINYNVSYDVIIINGYIQPDDFLKIYNNINKKRKPTYISICHGQCYDENILNTYFDKVICVSKFNYDLLNVDIKKYIIYNPIDNFLFENNVINDKQLENSIIITYHRSKGNHKLFLNKIYPLVKKKIPDFKVYIAQPIYYRFENDAYTEYINYNDYKNDKDIIFMNNVNSLELYNIYKKIPVSWDFPDMDETCPYNAMEHLLCYIHLISPMTDGTQYICSKTYSNKYKLLNTNYEYIDYEYVANEIIDRICNYNLYKNDLINEYNFILNNFSKDKILKEYKNIILCENE